MASLLAGAPPPPMASQSGCLSSSTSLSRSQTLLVASVPASFKSFSSSVSFPTLRFIYCGRGDKKTERGKRFNHSFGNARPRDKKKGRGPPSVPVPPSPPKKDRFDDDSVVKIEIDESLFSG